MTRTSGKRKYICTSTCSTFSWHFVSFFAVCASHIYYIIIYIDCVVFCSNHIFVSFSVFDITLKKWNELGGGRGVQFVAYLLVLVLILLLKLTVHSQRDQNLFVCAVAFLHYTTKYLHIMCLSQFRQLNSGLRSYFFSDVRPDQNFSSEDDFFLWSVTCYVE